MTFVRRAVTLVTATFVGCTSVAATAAQSAAQPVRAGDAAATTAQQQPVPPRTPPRKPRTVKGGVSPQVLAAVALGLGGVVIAVAASGGRTNASPR